MKKWEYTHKGVLQPMVTMLNEMGQDGWELVSVVGDDAYFKRPLETEWTWEYGEAISNLRDDQPFWLFATDDSEYAESQWEEEYYDDDGAAYEDCLVLKFRKRFEAEYFTWEETEVNGKSCFKVMEKPSV